MEENGGGVFSNRKKHNPTTQKSPNAEEANEDRLSSLPDFLILHILSFLETQEVVKFCVLSKRWQFLWTMVSELDLRDDDGGGSLPEEFVERVGRMLSVRSGFHLKRFAVSFDYEKRFASDVNSWVRFILKNKVEDISLKCQESIVYVIPQELYLHSSVTSLHIVNCEIDPRGIIDWGSLKRLEIENVELTNSVMEKILSGCPVLEVLISTLVIGITCFNITSPNLTTLKLHDRQDLDYDDGDHVLKTFFEISAPHLLVLSIKMDVGGLHFKLRNISSLVQAEIFINEDSDNWKVFASLSTMSYMKELLLSLNSVMDLELGPWCTEIISSLELKGWKLAPSPRLCLKLHAFCHEGILPGIFSILKSSPYLETLVIKRGMSVYGDEKFVTDRTTYLQDHRLDLVMSHLKTIEITGFTIEFLLSEAMLILVELLLKSSNVLEKMVIREEKVESSSSGDSSWYVESNCLVEFALKLLTFPRASPKAVVIVC